MMLLYLTSGQSIKFRKQENLKTKQKTGNGEKEGRKEGRKEERKKGRKEERKQKQEQTGAQRERKNNNEKGLTQELILLTLYKQC